MEIYRGPWRTWLQRLPTAGNQRSNGFVAPSILLTSSRSGFFEGWPKTSTLTLGSVGLRHFFGTFQSSRAFKDDEYQGFRGWTLGTRTSFWPGRTQALIEANERRENRIDLPLTRTWHTRKHPFDFTRDRPFSTCPYSSSRSRMVM